MCCAEIVQVNSFQNLIWLNQATEKNQKGLKRKIFIRKNVREKMIRLQSDIADI